MTQLELFKMTRSSSKKRSPASAASDPRFAAPTPEAATLSSSQDLQVQAATKKPLSRAAEGFQREWRRIERIKKKIAEIEAIGTAHQANVAAKLYPLQQQVDAAQIAVVRAIDPWLDEMPRKGGLTPLQHQTARTMLCIFSADLAERGHSEMAELHAKRAPAVPTAEQTPPLDNIDTDDLRDMWKQMLHVDLPDDVDVRDPASVFKAVEAQMAAEAAAQATRREARKAKRKPSAAAQQAASALATADTDLRKIYRQLASALHPDRATTDADRQRMTALMSEANAAYAQKDLIALLNLQWQAELVDADHLERQSDERLQSLTLLLKQQSAELERERQQAQQRWAFDLQLPAWMPFKPETLSLMLEEDIEDLNDTLLSMQTHLAAIQELPTLKKWLNTHRQHLRAAERQEAPHMLFGF